MNPDHIAYAANIVTIATGAAGGTVLLIKIGLKLVRLARRIRVRVYLAPPA